MNILNPTSCIIYFRFEFFLLNIFFFVSIKYWSNWEYFKKNILGWEISLYFLTHAHICTFLYLTCHFLNNLIPTYFVKIIYINFFFLFRIYKNLSKLVGISIDVIAEINQYYRPDIVRSYFYISVINVCLIKCLDESLVIFYL